MRASEVRTHITTLVEAITPDAQHGVNTTFRLLDTNTEPATAPARSFRLKLVRQPKRIDLNTEDPREAEWALDIFYPWSLLIDDVIGDDSDRVEVELCASALIALDEDAIDLTATPVGVDEQASLVTSRFSVVARYRLDSSVLT